MTIQTTVMRDSQVGDAWIAEACRLNPVQHVIDEATGQPNGNMLSGPVRLVFTDNLLTAGRKMKSDPNSKVGHQCGILWTPYSDLTLVYNELHRIAQSEFAGYQWNPYRQGGAWYDGLDNPIVDQGSKAMKYKGFTPGLFTTNLSSNFPPPVVDTRNNPVTPDKVYPGAWAIVAMNFYASGKQAPRKGPRCGLVSVMIIGDDTNLGGAAADPRTTFKGVSVKPPVAIPQGGFGQHVQPAPGYGAPAVQQFQPTSGPGPGGYAAPHPAPGPVPGYPQPQHPIPQRQADDEDYSQFR